MSTLRASPMEELEGVRNSKETDNSGAYLGRRVRQVWLSSHNQKHVLLFSWSRETHAVARLRPARAWGQAGAALQLFGTRHLALH